MTVVVQISDTHFGTERASVVEALVRMVREQAPGLVVLSGDITQRARRSQFRAAGAFVKRLGVPVTLAIPGNHDISLYNVAARLLSPYANHQREFGSELEPSHETDSLLVVTVNTTRSYLHENGAVSTRQIERVAARLQQASEAQLRIVVTHQPVSVIRPEDRPDLLRGHDRAVRRWSAAGADLILGGHIHLPFVQALHRDLPGLPRRVWAVQAGTAVSTRVRHEAGNSVNLIRCSAGSVPRRCVVERWDYQAETDRFAPVAFDEIEFDASTSAAVAH
jgi:3',5'-cyclic AMP phosphodiesterase CpdA